MIAELVRRPVFGQFIRFCVVGGSSFLIDAGLHRWLMFHAQAGGEPLRDIVGNWALQIFQPGSVGNVDSAYSAAFTLFKIPSAAIAIVNSFVWNRLWTFRIKGKEDVTMQLTKFIVISLIGMVLNVGISSGVNEILPLAETTRWLIATVVAAGFVAIWNFMGQKLWAFRKTSS